jgi:hypothetical protein
MPDGSAWQYVGDVLGARRLSVFNVTSSGRVRAFLGTCLVALLCSPLLPEADAFQRRRYIPPNIFKRQRIDLSTKRPQPPKSLTRKPKSAPKSTWHDETKRKTKTRVAVREKRQPFPYVIDGDKVDSGRRHGYEDGYDRGFDTGNGHRAANVTVDYRDDCEYQAAEGNYVTVYGPQFAYQDGYRTGFEQGYAAGRAGGEYANINPARVSAHKKKDGEAIASESAQLHGWREHAEKYGYEDGMASARHLRDASRIIVPPTSQSAYKSALNGWTEDLCDKAEYQERYRRYFVLGYATVAAERGEKKKQAAEASKRSGAKATKSRRQS